MKLSNFKKNLVLLSIGLLNGCYTDNVQHGLTKRPVILFQKVGEGRVLGRVLRKKDLDALKEITWPQAEEITLYREAQEYLKKRETFFHVFFTMRDKVGGDAELINILGIDAQVYFNFVQQLMIPENRHLDAIYEAVLAHKELRSFHPRLRRAANIESTIEAGNIYYRLERPGDIMVNDGISGNIRKSLHNIRTQAEQEAKAMLWGQSVLIVETWLKRNQTVSDIMQEIVATAGGSEALADKLQEKEALIGSCVRGGIHSHQDVVERIIAKLRALDDTDELKYLKYYADELENSVAMETAIDEGAIIEHDIRKRPTSIPPLAEPTTIQRFQQELSRRRTAALCLF